MISLILTALGIALVSILLLATLYYGGLAANSSYASAKAAAIELQAQQILAAADLVRVHTGQWPADMDYFVSSGYLKALPDVDFDGIGQAQPQNSWTMPEPGVPVFVLDGVPQEICHTFNRRYDIQEIGQTIDKSAANQCYQLGAEATDTPAFRVVAAKSTSTLAQAKSAIEAPAVEASPIQLYEVLNPRWGVGPFNMPWDETPLESCKKDLRGTYLNPYKDHMVYLDGTNNVWRDSPIGYYQRPAYTCEYLYVPKGSKVFVSGKAVKKYTLSCEYQGTDVIYGPDTGIDAPMVCLRKVDSCPVGSVPDGQGFCRSNN